MFAPSGFQNMFVESLTQLTGVDAGADTADTILSGNINTNPGRAHLGLHECDV